MKKIIGSLITCLFAVSLLAQDPVNDKTQKPIIEVKYCAKQKNSDIVVMQNKNELMVDVRLANGTVIKTDGTIIKSDGTQVKLKNGECADDHGNVILQKTPDKMNPGK